MAQSLQRPLLKGTPSIIGASELLSLEKRRTSLIRSRKVIRAPGTAFIIMVALQKGGVSKTETVACLAVLFQSMGLRVLVIEADAQGDCAYSLGVQVEPNDPTILEVLYHANMGYGFRYAMKISPFGGVAVIPANWRLSEQQNLLVSMPQREMLLARALTDDDVDADFDVVLVDCPPAFGATTWCAAAAAHVAEVPLQLHNRAWRALNFFETSLNQVVTSRVNPNLTLGGLMLTMRQKSTRQSGDLEDAAREEYKDLVYQSVIPFAARAAEAPLMGKPVVVYDPRSAVAAAYDKLSQEMAARYQLITTTQAV